ncbi:MAG: BCSC C-terminal domain-containing protein, partial [Gammaproteobacteria bacterium]|nr:BCSC C-terminal domain-containing protein [Gammaproteobacteria bacterium]
MAMPPAQTCLWPVLSRVCAGCLLALSTPPAVAADPVLQQEAPPSNILRVEPARPSPVVVIPGQPPPPDTTDALPIPAELPVLEAGAPEPPAAAEAISPAPVSRPDESVLWAMHEKQEYAALLAEIERLKSVHLAWIPPLELVELTRNALLEQRVRSAISAGSHGRLAHLEAAHPGHFGCGHVDWAWAAAEAYSALGDRRRLAAVLERLIPACRPVDRLTTLQKARNWLTAEEWEALAARESTAQRPPEVELQFRRLLYDHGAGQLLAAAESGDSIRIAALIARQADGMEEYQDPGAAMLAGWHYFREHDTARASVWFSRARQWDPSLDDATHALALCALKEKRFADAQDLANELPETHPGRAGVLRDAAVALAQAAQEQKNPSRVLAILAEAEQSGLELPRYARLMGAWASLQNGDPAGAAERFYILYTEQQDQESAEGLLHSMVAAGRGRDLDLIATAEPLAGMVRAHHAREMFGRKRFLAARALAPDDYGTLGSAGAPRLGWYGMLREKSGRPGLSMLDDSIQSVEFVWPSTASSELRLRLDQHNLDSGGLSGESRQSLARGLLEGALGLDPAGPDFAALEEAASAGINIDGTHGHVAGWEPYLAWRLESTLDLDAMIGLKLSGGAVDPKPLGRLSLQAHPDWGNYKVAGFVRPIRESILSYTGLRLDRFSQPTPFTGTTWGAVRGRGAEISAYRAFDYGLSLNGKVMVEHIDGRHVHDNMHESLNINLGRNFQLPGMDYTVAGINFAYDHYDHNLSQFTPGHGGYFSPQNFWQARATFDFQTAESRRAMLKGHLEGGRAFKREAVTP